MEQKTPIVDALRKYSADQVVRFHMPGHKGSLSAGNALQDLLGQPVFAADVTNVPGMDDLHQTHGIIGQAQELAARACGADRTYFLINGSSCGLQALVLTVCGPGDKILVPRNMHRSILSGIILSGAVPVFYLPEYDQDLDLPLGVLPETIAAKLAAHPDVKAVMLVNPTYHGILSDVAAIAGVVHDYGIPLLVDEAHGPHLPYHPDLPAGALTNGADATVHGTHKITSAFTQASMLHLKGSRIDRQRLEATLRLLQSTSTSYLLLASLDAARAQFEAFGEELLGGALTLASRLRSEVNEIPGLRSFGREIVGSHGVFDLDPTKVTVVLTGLPATGNWAEGWLRETRRIQVEMSDLTSLLMIVSFGNSCGDIDYLLASLRDMAAEVGHLSPSLPAASARAPLPALPAMVLNPGQAFRAPMVTLPLEEAVDRVVSEVIACYPPGIPVICPGERLTREILEYLLVMRAHGLHFQGCFDPALETVRVVR